MVIGTCVHFKYKQIILRNKGMILHNAAFILYQIIYSDPGSYTCAK